MRPTRGQRPSCFPKSDFAKSQQDLQKLICHELFHVLSRHNPELRERLYRIIGFTKCNEIDLPPELQRRKITNPDAPRNDYFIRVQVDGRQSCVVPLLISRVEKYDVERGGEFFAYITLQFLVAEKEIGSANLKTVFDGSSPKVVGLERVSGFIEQVGRNTDYIIHPEEILADNFALLVSRRAQRAFAGDSPKDERNLDAKAGPLTHGMAG